MTFVGLVMGHRLGSGLALAWDRGPSCPQGADGGGEEKQKREGGDVGGLAEAVPCSMPGHFGVDRVSTDGSPCLGVALGVCTSSTPVGTCEPTYWCEWYPPSSRLPGTPERDFCGSRIFVDIAR